MSRPSPEQIQAMANVPWWERGSGWAPSAIFTPTTGLITGDQFMGGDRDA